MFDHYSVLKQETVKSLNIKPDGIYIDCTLGGAGHSIEIAKQLTTGLLIGFDQDIEAIKAAEKELENYMDRVKLVHANFRYLKEELMKLNITEVDGILFDLGVSSPQLDQKERGFSYQQDAQLDMRMDQSQELTALEVVNEWSFEHLMFIFSRYGEERFSKRVARRIESARNESEIHTTEQLSEIIKDAIPAATRRTGGHPAKRVFQAIRIAVNDELGAFNSALHQSAELVKIDGRISVITFHSLEDRLCKKAFRKWSTDKHVPRNMPIIPEGHEAPFTLINRKAIIADEEELDENRRSRSAKLRTAEKKYTWDETFGYEEGWKKR